MYKVEPELQQCQMVCVREALNQVNGKKPRKSKSGVSMLNVSALVASAAFAAYTVSDKVLNLI